MNNINYHLATNTINTTHPSQHTTARSLANLNNHIVLHLAQTVIHYVSDNEDNRAINDTELHNEARSNNGNDETEDSTASKAVESMCSTLPSCHCNAFLQF